MSFSLQPTVPAGRHSKLRGRVLILVALFCVLQPEHSRAFKPDEHNRITSDSLSASTVTSLPNTGLPVLQFGPKAIEKIAKANEKVDGFDLIHGGTIAGLIYPHHHFDDNKLEKGADHLITKRQEIIESLRNASNVSIGSLAAGRVFDYYIENAQSSLGQAHHTIQDFYSHSNWVESSKDSIEKLWWRQNEVDPESGLTRNPFRAKSSTDCTCGMFTNYVGLPPSAPLVTGWFRLTPTYNDPRKAGRTMMKDALDGRCIHGAAPPIQLPVRDNFMELPPECATRLAQYPIVEGINKDNPQSEFFLDAKLKATQASAAFAQSIVEQAQTEGLNRALCAFLGYEYFECSFIVPPVEYELELPFYRVGDTYYTDEAFTFDVALFDSSLGDLEAVRTEWSVEFAGTGTCPEDPSQIISGANQCHFTRAIHRFGVSTENPDAIFQWLYCDTGFDAPTSTNPTGRFDVCGINGLFFGSRAIFDYIAWPGGTQSFERLSSRPKRYIVRAGSTCGLCSDVVGSSTFQLDGSFVSRLTGFLGIDNGPGAEPSSYTGTSSYLEFQGALKIKLRVTYEYSTAPVVGIGSQPFTSNGGDDE